jgi:hypothetical protein
LTSTSKQKAKHGSIHQYPNLLKSCCRFTINNTIHSGLQRTTKSLQIHGKSNKEVFVLLTIITSFTLPTSTETVAREEEEEEEDMSNSSDVVNLSRSLENVQTSRKSYKTPTRKEAGRSIVQRCSITGCLYFLYIW